MKNLSDGLEDMDQDELLMVQVGQLDRIADLLDRIRFWIALGWYFLAAGVAVGLIALIVAVAQN